MKRLLLLFALCSSACLTTPPVVTPTPPLERAVAVVVNNARGARYPGASVTLQVSASSTLTQVADATGVATFLAVPGSLTDTQIGVTVASGCQPYSQHATLTPVIDQQVDVGGALTGPTALLLPPLSCAPPFPGPPTRAALIHVGMTFQGLTCQTTEYGSLNWFDAALFSLTPADRQALYACKHAAGDTHAVVTFDSNSGSIYNEPGQPYQQMNGPAFANNLTGFALAVQEVRSNGFLPLVFLGGDDGSTCGQSPVPPLCGYSIATSELPLAINALQNAGVRDLSLDVCFLPGWDGVFYGWTPSQVTAFGQYFRSLLPTGCLGIEQQTGHIPIGGGPGDWQTGGPMQAYDLVLAEFNDSNIHDDATWQILGRLLGPAYHRPADQPATDDPTPPAYLSDPTPRGPFGVDCFEYAEYEWVRGIFGAQQIADMRAYLTSLGCASVS